MGEPRYRFWTEWSGEDSEWVGRCDGFPLLSWLDPERESAAAGIRALVDEVCGYLSAHGKPLPEPGTQWPPKRREAPMSRVTG